MNTDNFTPRPGTGESAPAYPTRSDNSPTPPTDVDALLQSLALLSPLEYDKVRKEHAKDLGVQVKTLDALVKAQKRLGPEQRLPYTEHEPWPEPVDPELMLNEIVQAIRRYIVIDPEQADAAALWVTHTHLVNEFDVSPIAVINAPERACAKTLFQEVLALLARRSMSAANASLSAIFRLVEMHQPTMFIDEADTFFKENHDLHGLVNAGYKRGGYVLRAEATGDTFEPRMFSVYSAKSIAGIALERHLPDATMSRGIVFKMRRKLPQEHVERFRNPDLALFSRLASQMARFALDHAPHLRKARPALPESLGDRDQDNWEPLLAIAHCAGQAWVDRALAAALKLSGTADSAAGLGNELLADVRDVWEAWESSRIKTVDLIAKLTEDEERAWATYNRGKPISPRQLARLLDAYGIKSKTIRLGKNDTPKGYERSQFDDVFRRYLQHPSQVASEIGHAAPGPITSQEDASNADDGF